MDPLLVLIVEDEPFVSMQIAEIVEETVPAVVIVKSSVKETKAIINQPFKLALLDVDVTNGKTYEIAHLLYEKHVPCVFVSGSARDHLPPELRALPFIRKPFRELQIRDAVLAVTSAPQ